MCSVRCDVSGNVPNLDVQTAAKVHTHSIPWNEILTEEWRINCQEISSNVCLILSHNMYDSARDVPLNFTDRNSPYTELTDGFCDWEGVFTARYGLNNLKINIYLWEFQTFYIQCQYWTVLLAHSCLSYRSYRYAVLCTLCCFLPLRSTNSAILKLLSISFCAGNTKFPKWIVLKLYN